MKVVVHDASILIDLALSECVEAWFATGIETWTSDLIYPREVSALVDDLLEPGFAVVLAAALGHVICSLTNQ